MAWSPGPVELAALWNSKLKGRSGTPCDLELSFFLAAACFTMDRFFSSYRTVIFLATESARRAVFSLSHGLFFFSDELLFVLATDFLFLNRELVFIGHERFLSHDSFVFLGKVSWP